jgi:hypothetical protein
MASAGADAGEMFGSRERGWQELGEYVSLLLFQIKEDDTGE